MANYSVLTWHTAHGDLDEVSTELKTKLNTLDSTNNSLIYVDIHELSNREIFEGVLIYEG